MNKLVLCDLDGTLIDSREDLASAVNLMRAEYGLSPLSIDAVAEYVGNGAAKLVERALKGHSFDLEKSLQFFRTCYKREMFNKTCLYTTVREGLALLHKSGVKIVLTSNKPNGPCEEILRHLKVLSYFDIILGASPEYQLKPDPGSIFIAIDKTSSSPEDAWIIGDNWTDLEAGRRAVIKRCFAGYGFGKKGDEDCDLEVGSFMEFAEYIVSKSGFGFNRKE